MVAKDPQCIFVSCVFRIVCVGAYARMRVGFILAILSGLHCYIVQMAPSPGEKRNYLKKHKSKDKSISTKTIIPGLSVDAADHSSEQPSACLTSFELPKTYEQVVRLSTHKSPQPTIPPQSAPAAPLPAGKASSPLRAPPSSPDGIYTNQMATTINEAAKTIMNQRRQQIVDRDFSDTLDTQEAAEMAREINTIAPQLTDSQLERQNPGQSPRSYVDAISQTLSLSGGGKVLKVVRINQPVARKFLILKEANNREK